jgi:hypothetical protein
MKYLKKHFWLFICIIITILLRFPSVFEPYWHGDEGISLALGQAIRRGELIYRDITDNKPPMLYLIYSIGGTLAWAKGILLLWSIGTVTSFYFLAILIMKKYWAILATLFFSIILNIPLFEGNVANGEIFFVLPTTLGMLLLWKYKDSFSLKPFFFIGMVFSIGFLFKVPAAADFLGALIFLTLYQKSVIHQAFLKRLFVLFIGFIIPLLVCLIPYLFSGALSDFMTYVFFRNLSYSSWQNNFRIPYFIFLAVFFSILFIRRKTISPSLLFICSWFFLAVLGSRISIRPYTHYLIQVLPSLGIALFFLLSDLRRNFLLFIIPLLFYFVIIPQFPLNKGSIGYQYGYYRNYLNYVTGKKDVLAYRTFFDPHVQRTYDVSKFLQTNTKPTDYTFVWSDDAHIYNLSLRPPLTKYIVAYITSEWDPHFKDSIAALSKNPPKYIVVSTERIDVFPFPYLSTLLSRDYTKDVQFRDMIIYKNISKKI